MLFMTLNMYIDTHTSINNCYNCYSVHVIIYYKNIYLMNNKRRARRIHTILCPTGAWQCCAPLYNAIIQLPHTQIHMSRQPHDISAPQVAPLVLLAQIGFLERTVFLCGSVCICVYRTALHGYATFKYITLLLMFYLFADLQNEIESTE